MRNLIPSGPPVQSVRTPLCYDNWWQAHVYMLFMFSSLLGLFAVVFHWGAQAKISVLFDHPGMWSAAEYRNMFLIALIDQHPSWAIAYLIVSLGLLGTLLLRRSSWWAPWLTFGALALPVLLYSLTCAKILNRLVVAY